MEHLYSRVDSRYCGVFYLLILRRVFLIYEEIVSKRLVFKSILSIDTIHKQRGTNKTDIEKVTQKIVRSH